MDAGNQIVLMQFEQELLRAEEILSTKFSFELAEDIYLRCIDLIKDNLDMKDQFVHLIFKLFDGGRVSSEPISYLMHNFKWECVKEMVEHRIRLLSEPMAEGSELQRILDSFDEEWSHIEFYKSL